MTDNELADIRNREIGFVFQTFNLLPRVNCLQNVELPLVYSGMRRGLRKEKAANALESVGLGDRMDHKPNELSGGAASACSCSACPGKTAPLSLWRDEPTGKPGYKKRGRRSCVSLSNSTARANTLLVVTHEEDIAQHARRIIRLRDGLIESDVRVDSPVLAGESLAMGAV